MQVLTGAGCVPLLCAKCPDLLLFVLCMIELAKMHGQSVKFIEVISWTSTNKQDSC